MCTVLPTKFQIDTTEDACKCKGRMTLTSCLDCSCTMSRPCLHFEDLPRTGRTSGFSKLIFQMVLCCPSRDGGVVAPEPISASLLSSQCLSETPTFPANCNRVYNYRNYLFEAGDTVLYILSGTHLLRRATSREKAVQ